MPSASAPWQDAARQAGHHRWVEMRLFELTGSWVPTVPEPAVKVRLYAGSFTHAWHAELWRQRIPELAGMAADDVTIPADDGTEALLGALAAGDSDSLARLIGLHRVLLPRVAAAYRAHQGRASPVSDGPALRALQLVLRDHDDEAREAELLMRSLLATEHDVRRAAAVQARLEALLRPAPGGQP